MRSTCSYIIIYKCRWSVTGRAYISMTTQHRLILGAAQKMDALANASIDLVVTSPPYPMIEMWDSIMAQQSDGITAALSDMKGDEAFELMHLELDKVWREAGRVLKPGGFACINIGDATRTLGGRFALYPNHARIISAFLQLGLANLPNILWRKQTNAPNKFMGSGMLPAGAYVTLEHEWILIFRKGGKRVFKSAEEKQQRNESAFFWEERNTWFSDLWDLKGTKQNIKNSETRERSAAYPFEVPYRLINMYSLKGDTVLDPFLGTGTTTVAALTAERNSVGYEIDSAFSDISSNNILNQDVAQLNACIRNRVVQHREFIQNRLADPKKDAIKHFNESFGLPVITSQERGMNFSFVKTIRSSQEENLLFQAQYISTSSADFSEASAAPAPKKKGKSKQAVIGL